MSSYLIDIGFVVVVFISLAIGIGRGFVRSVLSVVSWIVSAWLTWQFADLLSAYLAPLGISGGLQRPIAYIGLFFVSLLIASIVSAYVSGAIISPQAVRVDRTLGAAFGLVRGGLIVLGLIIVGSITVYVDQQWWKNSIAVAAFDPWVGSIRDWLSDILATSQPNSANVPNGA